MRFHSAAHGLFQASNYAGHAASHAFAGRIVHTLYNAMLYSTLYRIMRHVPLPIMIVIVVVVILVGYNRSRTTGRPPWYPLTDCPKKHRWVS
ncbi:MAG: hypothetical protein ABF665_19170 [Gluconacetobacter sp.]